MDAGLSSWRPFHPDRLLANIEALGGGPRRARGCFWLPSRPKDICGWDGAGGQLSVGVVGQWNGHEQVTRIFVTGMDVDFDALDQVFHRTLLSDDEIFRGVGGWAGREDGLDAWLGPVEDVA